MNVVTILARNYLPRATVLARSVRRHDPYVRVSLLVVDALPGELPDTEDYVVLTPEDLPVPPVELARMKLIYDVSELCTALKPWALQALLDDGAPVAVHLDPDIVVHASLAEVEKLALEHGIVLTPHRVLSLPRDDLYPRESDLMAAGTFNLGFLAVDDGARPMLAWWQERLLRDCIAAPAEGLFVDQRWIDLVPGLFPHVVLTDPTYNVAYWNLDTRTLARESGRLHVVGHGPLTFLHFSGYDPEQPWLLTTHFSERPRVVLSEHPVLAELCDEYAALITDPALAPPGAGYRFDRLADGTLVTPPMRRALRHAMVRSDRSGEPHPPGWDEHEAVRAWFLGPMRAGCTTNRYLHAVWSAEPVLQAAFPAPLSGDAAPLLEWAWHRAAADPSIVADLLPAPSPPPRPSVVSTPGVNVAGYFAGEMGVGQMGRLVLEAVRASGLPCSTVLNTETVSRQEHAFDGSDDQTPYPVTVAAVNADLLPHWTQVSDPSLRAGHLIGLWAWEVEEFSGYDEALGLVDEVWALSEFGRDAIARATTKPVHVLPLHVPEPPPAPPLDREALGLPAGPYLLFVFDHLSVFERKNPLGLLEAFRRAFPESDGPALVIKSVNGHLCRGDRERLRRAVGADPRVLLLEDYLDHGQVGALMDGCAAYVSLHRSEGYGLTMAEAMARGRPVVATAYSGNLDFMDDETGLLVPYELVPVPPGCEPYPVTTVWADPDLDAAAAHLRWVVEHPDEAEALGRRAATRLRETATLARAATFVIERVEAALAPREEETQVEAGTGPAKDDVRRRRGRYAALQDALAAVRRRADRAYQVGMQNRRDLKGVTLRTEALEDGQVEGRMQAARLDRLAEDVARLRADVTKDRSS